MAVYNGARFLKSQLDSILDQLTEDDVVIIVDDCSCDNSLALINSYHDKRILVHKNNSNMGHVRAFEKAISMVDSKYIFLADQDDIWVPGRVQFMIDFLEASRKDIVFTNFDLIDQYNHVIGPSLLCFSGSRRSLLLNLFTIFRGGAIPYWGCASMFRSAARNYILPFPTYVEAHDLWIALSGTVNSTIITIDKVSLLHRVHESNATPRRSRSFLSILKSRIILLFCLIIAGFRRMFSRRHSL